MKSWNKWLCKTCVVPGGRLLHSSPGSGLQNMYGCFGWVGGSVVLLSACVSRRVEGESVEQTASNSSLVPGCCRKSFILPPQVLHIQKHPAYFSIYMNLMIFNGSNWLQLIALEWFNLSCVEVFPRSLNLNKWIRASLTHRASQAGLQRGVQAEWRAAREGNVPWSTHLSLWTVKVPPCTQKVLQHNSFSFKT